MKIRPLPPSPLNSYPEAAFPIVVRDAISEMVANTQVPSALAAMVFLASMSASMQHNVEVLLPIGGSSRPTSLFCVLIASSGERKSVVERLVFAPIREMDAKLAQLHKLNEARYRAEHEIWTARKKRLLADLEGSKDGVDLVERLALFYEDEPVRPRLRQILHLDISERALIDALEGEGESISIICDEGELALRSVLLTKTGLLNTAWSGGNISLARANGVRVSVNSPRVGLAILVQPQVLDSHLQKYGPLTRGAGFWARVLLCFPASTQGMRFISPYAEQKWEKLKVFHDRQREILMQRLENVPSRYVYEFDDDAKQLWTGFVNTVEAQLQPFGHLSDVRDVASKSGEMAARIAALFHHFAQQPGKITAETLRSAGMLVEFHIAEFKRLFSTEPEVPQFQIDAQNLESYLHRAWWSRGTSFVPRNLVLQRGPIRPRRRLDESLQYLVLQGKLQLTVDNKRRHWIGLPVPQQQLGGYVFPSHGI